MRFLPPITDPNVLVGLATADDAAVIRVSDDLAITLTVDYFTPVVDDPYWFGAIGAANALSDTYAMGAVPVAALNLVGFPTRKLPMSILEQIIRGGADKAAEAGISIVGGHSIDDAEPKYGLVVMGKVKPDRVVTNAGARPGDVLILTKPIGTGIISTAAKAQMAPEAVLQNATQVMAALNRDAADAMLSVGAHACTDVTGYGLLGHLREMCAASKVGARVSAQSVPVMPGVYELAEQGLVPRGTHTNLEFVNEAARWDDEIDEVMRLVLCDAQTSGGLLIALPQDRSAALSDALKKRGVMSAQVGVIVDEEPGSVAVTRD